MRKKRKKDKKIKGRKASAVNTQPHSESSAQTQTRGKLPPVVYMSRNRVLEFTNQCTRHWQDAVAKKDAEIENLRDELKWVLEENRRLRARLARYEGEYTYDNPGSPFSSDGAT